MYLATEVYELGFTSKKNSLFASSMAMVVVGLFVTLAISLGKSVVDSIEEEVAVPVKFVQEVAKTPELIIVKKPPIAAPKTTTQQVRRVQVKAIKTPVSVRKANLKEANPALLASADASLVSGAAFSDEAYDAQALPDSATAPKPFGSNITPTYPQAAKEANITGIVVVKVVIGTDGKVEKTEVLRGPNVLVEAAVDAIKSWRYEPATYNGEPIRVFHIVKIPFRLRA